jgi:predicted AAA+ superfamily ATPase
MKVSADEIPCFTSTETDLNKAYKKRLKGIEKYGYGIFSSQVMFRLTDDRKIEPIVSADKTAMDKFIGYEEERGQVIENTRAFVQGRPSANVLLCGDAGTGKSSTVKAVANAFFNEGVRLIELRKDQLSLLPSVMANISGNPLKFIIFIDDLAFNRSDDNFSMLKAALEGSASAKADNAVIYATSNRRHIIKESFSDREGDDVHRNDTLQETLSLSERFGLVVTYSKPNKALYLTIVKKLAEKFGVRMDEKELEIKAEAFALKKGNRSARCAEQFINSLL